MNFHRESLEGQVHCDKRTTILALALGTADYLQGEGRSILE